MSEPRRLLADPEATTFERDLLESWSSEAPSPAARARALALAGLAAGAVTATATAAATSTSAAGAAAAAPKVVAAAGLSGATKLGILGAMVLASAVMSAVIVRSSHEAAPVPSAYAPSAPAPSAYEPAKVPAPVAPPVTEPPSVALSDLPAAPSVEVPAAAAPSSARAQASASAHADTPSSLSEEIASFDRARSALEAGELDRALGLVDAYEKRFPAGTFVQEAEVLRVKALAAKGDRAGARRAGERFLSAHPTSPHAPRIRAILDSSPP
jgi:TolA-binding protein